MDRRLSPTLFHLRPRLYRFNALVLVTQHRVPDLLPFHSALSEETPLSVWASSTLIGHVGGNTARLSLN